MVARTMSKTSVAVVGAGEFGPFLISDGRQQLSGPPPAYTAQTGPSGLSMLKQLRDDGFSVTGYERRGRVGGLWAYSEDLSHTSVLSSKSPPCLGRLYETVQRLQIARNHRTPQQIHMWLQ